MIHIHSFHHYVFHLIIFLQSDTYRSGRYLVLAVIFHDPDHFAQALGDYSLRVNVLGRGPFEAEMTSRLLGEFTCWHGAMTPAINYSWSSQEGRITVVFLDEGSPPMLRNGVTVTSDELILWPPHVECRSRVLPKASWGAITIPESDFYRSIRVLYDQVIPVSDRITRIRPSADAMTRLRDIYRIAMRITGPAGGEIKRSLQDRVIRTVAACVVEGRETAKISVAPSALRRFDDLLHDRGSKPIYVTEVCEKLGISERTLRNYTDAHYKMAPYEYLTWSRLNLVRRALANADPAETTVANIARQYGFEHLGRFASNYQHWFGEAPSTTLRSSYQRE
jgi:AraC-like DNA-binding protein